MKYAIVIHKDQESDYGVTFPDIPGCFSAGDTIEEAISMAQEAAECHIEGLLLDSEPVPVATPIANHQNKQDYQDALWALIEIDLDKLSIQPKRVNILITERLLTSIDHFAKKHGETRSELFAQAVTEYMSVHQ